MMWHRTQVTVMEKLRRSQSCGVEIFDIEKGFMNVEGKKVFD